MAYKAPFIFLGTIVEPVFEHVRLRFREPIFRRFETSPVLLFKVLFNENDKAMQHPLWSIDITFVDWYIHKVFGISVVSFSDIMGKTCSSWSYFWWKAGIYVKCTLRDVSK